MKRLLSMLVTIMLMSPSAMLLAQDEVYGWQLMSEQERAEHRAKMQNMNTEEERER